VCARGCVCWEDGVAHTQGLVRKRAPRTPPQSLSLLGGATRGVGVTSVTVVGQVNDEPSPAQTGRGSVRTYPRSKPRSPAPCARREVCTLRGGGRCTHTGTRHGTSTGVRGHLALHPGACPHLPRSDAMRGCSLCVRGYMHAGPSHTQEGYLARSLGAQALMRADKCLPVCVGGGAPRNQQGLCRSGRV
jgi:hypothetical protein